jgi:hypothetical protein
MRNFGKLRYMLDRPERTEDDDLLSRVREDVPDLFCSYDEQRDTLLRCLEILEEDEHSEDYSWLCEEIRELVLQQH